MKATVIKNSNFTGFADEPKFNIKHLCAECGEEFECFYDRSYCYGCSEDGVDLYPDLTEKQEVTK